MTSPFLNLPGAVGEVVASHYGAPVQEQRSLEAGDALVDLSHHGIVTVSGVDRLTWLHSMTSQQLAGLRAGESTETLLLDPNGRIEHAIRVVDDGETTWLLVDSDAAPALCAFLNRMRFALRVEIADRTEDFAAVLAFAGGSALPALRELQPAVIWEDPWAEITAGGIQYSNGEHPGSAWSATTLVFPRESLDEVAGLVRSGIVRAAGTMALDALEIRAWRPSQTGDVDERSIPHEFDWLRTAVHLNKGCYRGQETVAKVHNLGHPPRRLTLLHLDGSDGELPVPGALVFKAGEGGDAGARPVGRITRAALHHEWGGIALALLKRALPSDTPLEVRGGDEAADANAAPGALIAAAQEIIVPSDAGATRDIPKLKRL
ncbi:YgfZ/GcvT domain-containing protein [Leucobacter denitrificans]|uniref:Folate-binding protein YgfZ n=1 Tax=Leucobacter denitrificans TaxID=683042 RepID=A0A7G9S3S4_9MICO|nr:folate-binding protein YgfZ [Leucobacter denitrificans]QNN62499.1 folate-binding protein YgfZ [Leucobacter denitrificans]